MDQNIHVITFGGGKKKFRQAALRVKRECESLGLFSSVTAATDLYIKTECKDFWELHKKFILKNKRGFGYWLWKPYLIHKLLHELPENDILIYIDGGCTINPEGIERLKEYLRQTNEKQCLAFQMNEQPEKKWSKKDAIITIGNTEEDINSGQLIGTIIFLKNTPTIKKLVNEWCQLTTTNNYHFLDDSASVNSNDSSFKEHRHDQSLFSLLVKKYTKDYSFAILPDESYFAPNWFTNGKQYPIWATRNKSGDSFSEGNKKTLLQKIKNYFKKS